jgi:hypothetical protein
LRKLERDQEVVCEAKENAPAYFYFDIEKKVRSILVEAWSVGNAADPDICIDVRPLDLDLIEKDKTITPQEIKNVVNLGTATWKSRFHYGSQIEILSRDPKSKVNARYYVAVNQDWREGTDNACIVKLTLSEAMPIQEVKCGQMVKDVSLKETSAFL